MKDFYNILTLAVILISFNCTEEIPLETNGFEDVLVVEATISNELKHQEIKLSRTYFLEQNTQTIENNANVSIQDNLGNNYTFTQNDEGVYSSNIAFEALPNVIYTLYITTSNGKLYKSSEKVLTPIAEISSLYVEEGPDSNSVQVVIDSNNEATDAQFFRYEYEETHKIKVPYYSIYNAKLTNIVNYGQEFDVDLVLKEENEEICFTTNKSIGIIQTSTDHLESNIVSKFPVRTINKDNVILRERYSILVKQYVQSLEAYKYYETINELSTNESLFSENQPGFVVGNISALQNSSEKIIGFFDVSSVSSDRIYFNYEDIDAPRPPYPYDCELRESEDGLISYNKNHLKLNYALHGNYNGGTLMPNQRAILHNLLKDGGYYKYYSGQVVYYIVSPECGDCTSYSSNLKPNFWVD
ncbi:MAG: DUF4249 domain-containing protein [Bizionia sp.]|nr:DUF4249 domain-containing protein [Bizionia sp.]